MFPKKAAAYPSSKIFWLAGNVSEQVGDDLVGGFAFGVRLKATDDAVAQDERGKGSHIFAGHIEAAIAGGAGATGHDQVLAGARAGAPAHPALDVSRRGQVGRP